MAKKRTNILLVILLSGLLFSFAILVFNLVYQGQLPKIVEEINNASIGAILTAVITVFLLSQQSKTEEEKDKNATVFSQKMDVYSQFIDLLEKIVEDGQLDVSGKAKPDELKQLIFILGKIRIVSSMKSVHKISDYLVELFSSENATATTGLIVEKLNLIVNIFREELFPGDDDARDSISIEKLRDSIMGLTNQTLVQQFSQENTKNTVWYLNSGGRNWSDMREVGFWQAGGGVRYKEIIHKLKENDTVYVYISGKGYVGKGIVTGQPTLLQDLVINGKKIFEINRTLKTSNVAEENKAKSPEIAEYAVPIKWSKSVDESNAYRKEGIFASPLTACRLNNKDTIQFLDEVFA